MVVYNLHLISIILFCHRNVGMDRGLMFCDAVLTSNFRIGPFVHEVNDSSICLRICSVDAVVQGKRQSFIRATGPALGGLARPPSWGGRSFSGTRQCLRSKKKPGLLGIRIMCPIVSTCLPADCCFSELVL